MQLEQNGDLMKRELVERVNVVRDRIRDVLFNEWDPIGINDSGPNDEYDMYINGIYKLLATGTTIDVLMRHLGHLEVSSMHSPTSDDHRKGIAQQLLKIHISRRLRNTD